MQSTVKNHSIKDGFDFLLARLMLEPEKLKNAGFADEAKTMESAYSVINELCDMVDEYNQKFSLIAKQIEEIKFQIDISEVRK